MLILSARSTILKPLFMETLYLPCLKPRDILWSAFELMHNTNSRALVLEDDDEFTLYYNDIVAETLENRSKGFGSVIRCSALRNKQGTGVLNFLGREFPYGSALNDNLRSGYSLESIVESMFLNNRGDLGTFQHRFSLGSDNIIMLFTRHEKVRDDVINRHKCCVCTSRFRHTSNRHSTGDICNIDPPATFICT